MSFRQLVVVVPSKLSLFCHSAGGTIAAKLSETLYKW